MKGNRIGGIRFGKYGLLVLLTGAMFFAGAAPPFVRSAVAATYVVTSAGDDNDGGTLSNPPGPDGTLSLREAIEVANLNAGADTINFNIPGVGVHTIAPLTPLPVITDPVIMDGYTQPGASANTLANGENAVLQIELSGVNLGSSINAVGLSITAGSSTVRGLAINRCGSYGIWLQSSGNTIAGNFIGTDPTGMTAAPNNLGIEMRPLNFSTQTNNTIGGLTPAARNLVSGNANAGLDMSYPATYSNLVEGNFIGTNANGTGALGNGDGIDILGAPNNDVGGTASGARNVISGNKYFGINVSDGSASGNQIQGNFIGTDVTGAVALGNGEFGITLGSSSGAQSGNVVGGTTPGAGNIIAFNGGSALQGADGAGVVLRGLVSGDSILGNSIFSNTDNGTLPGHGLGIDLADDGVTPNHSPPTTSGPNNLENYPVLTSVVSAGGNTTIQGTFNGTASTNGFRIEFFDNVAADPTGFGEGQTFIGFTTVNTDAGGNAAISVTLPVTVASGHVVTSTATDPNGNTSEFSGCNTQVTSTNDSGAGSLRAAITCANFMPGTDTISFNIPGVGVHTITPITPLPAITDPVIIDGYTQPGALANTLATGDNAVILIELDGSGAAAGASGLVVTAGSSTVRGLIVNRFNSSGITLQTGGGNTITGNFIGTNSAGAVAQPNPIGIYISDSPTNIVGGTTPGARNLISANTNEQLLIQGTGSSGNQVLGNYIGPNAAGAGPISGAPNRCIGIYVLNGPANTTIGGTAAGAGNLISGNSNDGIYVGSAQGTIIQGNLIGTTANGTAANTNGTGGIDGVSGIQIQSSTNSIVGGTTAGSRNVVSGNVGPGIEFGIFVGGSGNTIQGNYIGVDITGSGALGNAGPGIGSYGAFNNTIGGAAAGAGNIIAFNTLGVTLSNVQGTGTGNAILSNSIFSNSPGLGIDLHSGFSPDGVTLNHSPPATSGPNNFENFPVITSVSSAGGNTTVQGTYFSTASTAFRLEFFDNAAADASGYGQGKTFIGFTTVNTDASGNAAINVTLTGVTVASGHFVTSTATDPSGNTSEFSQAFLFAPCTLIVTTTADSGPGSLRAAINCSNSTTPGPNTISFNIPGSGVHTIIPLSALPTITVPVVIDGYTQPGASPNTNGPGLADNAVLEIELNGTSTGANANGLTIAAGGSTVRGLVINRVLGGSGSGMGIALMTVGGNHVEGNFLGTNPGGTVALGNSFGVSVISGANNTIGGTTPAARNLISGNVADGISLYNSAAPGTVIQGNYIGTDASGGLPLGNGYSGVELQPNSATLGGTTPGAGNVISANGKDGVLAGPSNLIQGNFIGTTASGTAKLGNHNAGVHTDNANNVTIGGTAAGAGNVISGNVGAGIFIEESGNGSTGNVVADNRIGTDAAGTANLGNGGDGVRILSDGEGGGAKGNTIGGADGQSGNVIAFNGGNGVTVANQSLGAAPTDNSILGNSIFSNGTLGIDLGADGVTLNHSPPATSGPNNFLNFPVITSVVSAGGNTTIQGTFNSTASANGFRIEFFDNAAADPSGYGQGKTFIGFTTVNTDASGNATINVTLPLTVANGHFVTSTATDPNNNTSEFSRALSVSSPPPTLTITLGPNSPGPTTTYSKGSTLRTMLQFRATAGTSEAVKMTAITLQASGTGNDQTGVAAVRVYIDSNGNGQYDAGEPLVGTGTYNADNGTLTITFTTPQVVPAGGTLTYIVTYDFTS